MKTENDAFFDVNRPERVNLFFTIILAFLLFVATLICTLISFGPF